MRITEQQINQILSILRIRNSELDLQRIPIDVEKQMLQLVQEGRHQDLHISGFSKLQDNLGLVAENKITHYLFITAACITLVSRAAIDGGALPDDVFDLSDALLFSLGYMKEIDEIESLYQLAPVMMAKLVAAQKEKPVHFQVDRAKNYISKHIFKRITVDEIAAYVDLSPTYLCTLFSQETGISIHNYIQQEKIKISCNLLSHTDRALSDIALYMGFPTPSNFSSVFKKWMHMTPREYRQNHFREVF